MITEDYVSFEVAKLLKEKGFDWECNHRFDSDGIFRDIQPTWNWNMGANRYSAPTLQMSMKWLRDVHNILIVIDRHSTGYGWEIEDNTTGQPKGIGECNSYEEACEAAIKYCLKNLI